MRIAIAAILVASLITVAPPTTHAQIPSDLRHFLQTQSGDPRDPENADVTYRAASVHLHDGGEQYIVYWSGTGICGTGGCDMSVIERRGHTFHTVTETTVTRLPVRVLDSQTNGWQDIGVLVTWGEVRGYEARLRFNGKKYPSNPSSQPDSHHATGKTVLSESTPAVPLFPAANSPPR
jgi:hypothetical protein